MTTTTSTQTASIAHELVDLCREGKNLDAINKFYAPNIVSVEPAGDEKMPAEMSGINAVRGKHEWWVNNNEVHSAEVNGPFVSEDDQFVVHFMYDVTAKPTGQRFKMTELGLYTVKNGKIVREQFFYHMPGK